MLSAKRRILSCFEHLIDTDVIDFIILFFENNEFLNEIKIKMMCAFPLFTQDVIFPTENKKKKVRKLTKAQINKMNKTVLSSETIRRIHLYGLKKNSSEVERGVCYYLDKCLDKNGIFCGTGSVFCKNCFIPVHEKCVINTKLKFEGILFCSTECSTGQKLKTDKE